MPNAYNHDCIDAKVWGVSKNFEFEVFLSKTGRNAKEHEMMKNEMPKSKQVVTMKVRVDANVVVCLFFVILSSLYSQQHTKMNLLDGM